MNSMNMPGFTAEASVYKTRGHYRVAGTPNDLLGGRGVLPQLPIGFCMADCDFQNPDDPFMSTVCKFGCFDEAGGGAGGGGGRTCRPECGPCQPDPDSPTGGFRTCVQFNCDTIDKPCRARKFPTPIRTLFPTPI